MTSAAPLPPADVWDVLIVGQGLAGTALAWALHMRGQRVLLLDNHVASTASKVAAGLITPITGPRLSMSETFCEMSAAAEAFYAACEVRTGASFFHRLPAMRLFKSPAEQQVWDTRGTERLARVLLDPQPVPLVDDPAVDGAHGGFAMHTARLDTKAYLAASRTVLPCRAVRVDWSRDVAFSNDGVQVQGLRARRVISCEGFAAAHNPHLAWLPFRSVKGDILTVRFARPLAAITLHRGIWLAPTSLPDTFRVGATYDAHTLDEAPSADARAELEAKLRAFVHVSFDVIDHQAAVRPVLIDIKPAIGIHPHLPRLGYFNGLGSKGALQAPWFAEHFAAHLIDGAPLPRGAGSRAAMIAAEAL